ncbi:MAG TPA: hypothetical protein VN680_13465 [Burkholderiaceae bacterium]|jgi:hypothetical protein|nr:hypothetical protein [Burkholderiaceae bacterium]
MKRSIASLLAGALVCLILPAQADDAASRPGSVARDMGSDRAISGRAATQARPVEGDLFAAGSSVDVLAEVGGDALLAGGTVHVEAPVKRSVYAAGGRVSVDAPVQHNLRIAGGSLEIGPQARIGGSVSVGGGEVRILGPVTGYVSVGAGRVFINAPIGGDAHIRAGHIELGPKAAIAGKLQYSSRSEIVRDPAAQIAGAVERVEPVQAVSGAVRPRSRAGYWIWTAGLMALAAVLAAWLPRRCAQVRELLGRRPGASALAGFVALVCIPVAAVLLLITIIGAPLALLVVLIYPALLLLGYVASGITAGTMALARWKGDVMDRRGWLALAAALGVLAISLLARVPGLGAAVSLAALLLGMGGLLMSIHESRASPSARAGL